MPTEPVNQAVNWEERLNEEELEFNERERRVIGKIIKILRNHPEGLGFNELAKALKDDIARPTLSKVIERLEKAGVITRDREKWRPGKKMVIRLNPEFSRELEIVLAYTRDFRHKVLYIIKELRYEIAKGVIEPEKAALELDNICGNALGTLIIVALAVMHSHISKAYRKMIGSILLEAYVGIIDEILKIPEFGRIVDYLPLRVHLLSAPNEVFEEINKLYEQAVERARRLGVDEAIRRELGFP